VKCIIDCQVVLSRAPEGPLASHIAPFARSLSKQGYSWSMSSIPRAIAADQIRQLLASFDRCTAVGVSRLCHLAPARTLGLAFR